MTAEPASYDRASEPTLASEWHAASRGGITDDLLDWPPDLFARNHASSGSRRSRVARSCMSREAAAR
jgi:hypothetical protein